MPPEKTYYAPILIPTLNRYEHFKNCIESLQKNPWAKYTDLYIGLDYPPSEKYREGFNKILSYLDDGISGFASVTVLKRTYNYGPSKNIMDLLSTISKKYDRYILTEDDNIFSPCFIEYIDKCLEYYCEDSSVIGICGYSYLINWVTDENNVVSNNCFYSAWGHAMWLDKEKVLRDDINIGLFRSVFSDKLLVNRIKSISPKNYCYLVSLVLGDTVSMADIPLSIYMLISNKRCIQPKKSLVRNCGWDGSGVNCQSNDTNIDYLSQEIDLSVHFNLIHPESANVNSENIFMLNRLYPIPSGLSWIILKVVGFIIQILRPKLFFKIWDSIRHSAYLRRVYNIIKICRR